MKLLAITTIILGFTLGNQFALAADHVYESEDEGRHSDRDKNDDEKKQQREAEKVERKCKKKVNPFDEENSMEDCIAAGGKVDSDKGDKFVLKLVEKVDRQGKKGYVNSSERANLMASIEACDNQFIRAEDGLDRMAERAFNRENRQENKEVEKSCERRIKDELYMATHQRDDFALRIDRLWEDAQEQRNFGAITEPELNNIRTQIDALRAELPTVPLNTLEEMKAFQRKLRAVRDLIFPDTETSVVSGAGGQGGNDHDDDDRDDDNNHRDRRNHDGGKGKGKDKD